eukprot:TRINITY_DN137_c0_g1_i2.p3 TRINITY_DN137_c0_g1~~TRINITY_DN137_c0_g1_i2.p3  ORF type:complete len:190 (-),score=5.90 TRINITY_DN137_c0_g1_i2:109-678(-)
MTEFDFLWSILDNVLKLLISQEPDEGKLSRLALKTKIKIFEQSRSSKHSSGYESEYGMFELQSSKFFFSLTNSKSSLKILVSQKYYQKKNIMTFIFQLLLLALIAVSFLLVVGVPVVFASPNSWSENKGTVFSGLGIWILLVFAIGIFNSFVVQKIRSEAKILQNVSKRTELSNFQILVGLLFLTIQRM